MKDKLTLGTAQFGLNYGIANREGQVKLSEMGRILDYAWSEGLRTIDTAIAYGDSEERLGQVGVKGWDIISKLPPLPDDCSNVRQWAFDSVEASLVRLKITTLSGLLLHKPVQLEEERGVRLYEALTELTASSMVNQVGISVYEPVELDLIEKFRNLNIIQMPFNLIDRRFENSFERLKRAGSQIHVRSAFLQGLLLMDQKDRPAKFSRWENTWKGYEKFLLQTGMSRLSACLNYVLTKEQVDHVIFGVDSLEQLQEICAAADNKVIEFPASLENSDRNLINPAQWSTFE